MGLKFFYQVYYYIYILYHFILVPKKGQYSLRTKLFKVGQFWSKQFGRSFRCSNNGSNYLRIFKNYIYTFITLYWSKKRPVFILKALNLNINLHTNLFLSLDDLCRRSLHKFSVGSKMGLTLLYQVYYYIYIFITSYWSKKRPIFSSYEVIQGWAVLCQSSLDQVSLAPIMGLTF